MATNGEFLVVDAPDPMVATIAEDPVLLGAWGYLRLASRPMALSEIAAASSVDVATIRRRLDLLCAYGLVDALPATTRRPTITYRARYHGLSVRCQRARDEGLIRRVADAMYRHAMGLVSVAWPGSESPAPKGWSADFTRAVSLTPPEAAELRRRLDGVAEYTEALSAKYAKRGDEPAPCNYVVHFRAEPIPEPALPLAPIRFVIDGDADTTPGDRPSGGRLSAREREVANALARGLTIDEAAKEMGLARSTVSTLTKRVYRKLKVRRRAEMVLRLRELGLG
jgi:DNA-binding CsgD family transcriptional regulator